MKSLHGPSYSGLFKSCICFNGEEKHRDQNMSERPPLPLPLLLILFLEDIRPSIWDTCWLLIHRRNLLENPKIIYYAYIFLEVLLKPKESCITSRLFLSAAIFQVVTAIV